ncbi:MAG: universal stress protein [Actinomycetota bacterium]|nr:universal stress protein [Actinomycetota bacterium]
MDEFDRHLAQREAHARVAASDRPTRYGDVLNRYLEAATRPGGASTPAAARPPDIAAAAGLVVVGADDSPASCTAVDQAAIEAQLHGWALKIMTVRHPGRSGGPGHGADAELLERLSDRVRTSTPSTVVTSRFAVGSVSSSLLLEARHANLLVVGHRHGRGGSALGFSVAHRLAGLHPGVMLVVRMPGWPPGPGFGSRPLVVGVEHAGVSTPAAQFALREAHLRGCELIVVRAGRSLASASRVQTVDGVTVHHRTVDDDPVNTLTELSHHAAAVVVGRRGSGAHPLTMLGSISRAMLERAGCPVFLV